LAAVYRDDEKRSDLLVLDAENVEAEPLATVRLPHRIPFGFHGNRRPDRSRCESPRFGGSGERGQHRH
jgi:carotenoid cleavage dioxygenase